MANKLEKDIRDKCLKLAKKRAGVLHKRMYFGNGAAGGWPDDLFMFHCRYSDGIGAVYWWVEFKAPGGKPTPLQDEVHKSIRGLGGCVDVIDNVDDFAQKLEFYLS